jgi:hypothetical protein
MDVPPASRLPHLITRWKCALLTLLNIVIWLSFAAECYPRRGWYLGTGLAAISAATLMLRCGWVAPCMVFGIYFGLTVFDPMIKGGDQVSQMWETVGSMVKGLVLGFVVGLLLDARHAGKLNASAGAGERSDTAPPSDSTADRAD